MIIHLYLPDLQFLGVLFRQILAQHFSVRFSSKQFLESPVRNIFLK